MFSGLTSLIFGASESQPEPCDELDLQTKTEQGWVLVDMPGPHSPCAGQPYNPVEPCAIQLVEQHILTPSSGSSNSSACSSPSQPSTPSSLSPSSGHSRYCFRTNIGSTESWIITPPPCFTAGGTSSSQVEMSPMENLLIEHPSMSVYQDCQSATQGRLEEEMIKSSSQETDTVIAKHKHRGHKAVSQQAPRRPHAVAERAGLLVQIQNIKSPQRVEHYHNTRQFTRRHFERENKSRAVLSAGKQKQRKQFLKCPSGRKNGRLAQRHY